MTFTEESRQKAIQTQIDNYMKKNPGSTYEEARAARIEALKMAASKGGKKTRGYDFAHGKISPSEANRRRYEKH